MLCVAYTFVRVRTKPESTLTETITDAADRGSQFASVRTLGRLLDISEKTIWDWIYKSRRQPTLDPLPYYKISGLVRFRVSEIRAWLDRRRVRPTLLEGR